MSDTTTARRVGHYSQLNSAWTELPLRANQACEAAERVLAAYEVDPVTGLWPSGRAPSEGWQRRIDEAAAHRPGARPDDAEAAA